MPPKTALEQRTELAALTDLPAAAAWLLSFLGDARVVLFEGEMGAGKTTFIKEICRSLGVRDNVSSPTFALVNEYEDGNKRPVFHFDFYRINHEREALDIGAPEYFDSGHLCLIEWPSKIQHLLPEHYVLVEIAAGEGEARTITLKRN